MKNYLLVFLIGMSVVLVSCKDDEEPTPPHEVGVWTLDSYLTINLPAGYSRNEGRPYSIEQISLGGLVFESYTLEILKDGKYKREIELTGQPDFRDNGSWEVDDDELTLEDSNGDDESWKIERNENEQLWLSTEANFLIVPDAILDTITDAYLNGITQEQFEALFDQVSLDLVYAFEKD